MITHHVSGIGSNKSPLIGIYKEAAFFEAAAVSPGTPYNSNDILLSLMTFSITSV